MGPDHANARLAPAGIKLEQATLDESTMAHGLVAHSEYLFKRDSVLPKEVVQSITHNLKMKWWIDRLKIAFPFPEVREHLVHPYPWIRAANDKQNNAVIEIYP